LLRADVVDADSRLTRLSAGVGLSADIGDSDSWVDPSRMEPARECCDEQPPSPAYTGPE